MTESFVCVDEGVKELCGVAFTDGRRIESLKGEIGRMGSVLLLDMWCANQRRVGWARLWDATLDFGVPHTWGLQLLSRVLSHHGRGNHPCPLETSVMEHVWSNHFGELGLGKEMNSSYVDLWTRT